VCVGDNIRKTEEGELKVNKRYIRTIKTDCEDNIISNQCNVLEQNCDNGTSEFQFA